LTIASYFFNVGSLKKLVYIGNIKFREIFNKTLISSIVFLIAAIVLIPTVGIVGAAVSQLLGFATLYHLLKNDF
jgi:O-antigen/teichoic acid export membrane protein